MWGWNPTSSPSGLLDELSDEGGPAGLVVGAESFAGVAVEVFIEEEVVAPVGVLLIEGAISEAGSMSLVVEFEDAHESVGDFACDVPEVFHLS